MGLGRQFLDGSDQLRMMPRLDAVAVTVHGILDGVIQQVVEEGRKLPAESTGECCPLRGGSHRSGPLEGVAPKQNQFILNIPCERWDDKEPLRFIVYGDGQPPERGEVDDRPMLGVAGLDRVDTDLLDVGSQGQSALDPRLRLLVLQHQVFGTEELPVEVGLSLYVQSALGRPPSEQWRNDFILKHALPTSGGSSEYQRLAGLTLT